MEEDLEYKEPSFTEKFKAKFKESPFVIIGIFGVIGSCAYAGYRYKTRGPAISTSTFLMQLRLYAQGMFAGFAILGVATKVYQDSVKGKKEKENMES